MDYFTYTTLFAYGNKSDMTRFEKHLPINNDQFDFNKIIPIPTSEFFSTNETCKADLRNDLSKWCTNNWGSPSNGSIEEFRKIYGINDVGFEIKLRTAFSEPVLIFNKIMESNPYLNYFIHHQGFSLDEYMGFKHQTSESISVICESAFDDHYENVHFNTNTENLAHFRKNGIGYLEWEFLRSFKMGEYTINYLQNNQE
jgi:hypothetical protein